MNVRRATTRVLLAALASGAVGCHQHPLSPAVAGPNDAAADGETVDALRCGEGVSADPAFTVDGLLQSPGIAYVGRARVDESTPASLVLTLLDDHSTQRVTVSGAPAPALPVGRIAWVVYVVSPEDTFGRRESSWSLTVRDVEGGTVLFGQTHQQPGETLTPFALGALTSLCSHGDCPLTTEMALSVPDASPTTIPNGGTATLTLGTNAYRLWVHAETKSLGTCDATTFVPPLPLRLTYVANDLPGLAAGLATPAP